MKTRVALALSVALVIGTAACASAPQAGPGGEFLENTRWFVVSANGVRVPQGTDEAPFIVADPSSGRITGHSGCNAFNGPYRAGGADVVMGPFAITRKACPDLGTWESTLMEALASTDGYSVEAGTLELMSEGRVRITLQAGGGR